jgi:hypothetical protein
MVKISIRMVDGGLNEFDENNEIIQKLIELENIGLCGKNLIDNLITDDWGVPPKSVKLSYMQNNEKIEKIIFYD